MAAVRTSPARTPGPRPASGSSSAGSTRVRTRERSSAGSRLCGSSNQVSPAQRQIVSVSARVRPSRGRTTAAPPGSVPRAGIPARDRVPEPRASPRRTCSAWSSAVWAVRTTAAPAPGAAAPCPASRAAAARATRRARRASASGPSPVRATSTRVTVTGVRPRMRATSAAAAATASLPDCSPWSTTAAPIGPSRRPSRVPPRTAQATASARESAPPERATSPRG